MDSTIVLATLGWTEYLVIGLILLLLFGARKLPQLAESMGASIQSFKKGMRDGVGNEAGTASSTRPEDKPEAKH
jgi:sec-independent protein translocase protein TatA